MGYKGRVKTIAIKSSGAKYENGKWVHDDAFIIFTTIYQFGEDGNVTSRKDMTDLKRGIMKPYLISHSDLTICVYIIRKTITHLLKPTR